MFRDLKANEIDVRVGQIKANGLTLLLYKDARVDQDILDETVRANELAKETYKRQCKLHCRDMGRK